MLNELAYLTGMHGMFYVTLEKCYGGKFGNAILSKHSFDETRRIMLPCAASAYSPLFDSYSILLPAKPRYRDLVP